MAARDDPDAEPEQRPAEALHDISNALTVLLGWLEEAAGDDVEPALRARALAIAARKAREARALAREAIGASRPSERARPIGAVVREVVESLAIELDRARVRTQISGDGVTPVRGAAPLAQVVTNLLLNAIAFAPMDSTIRVDIAGDQERAEVTIVDDGPGVDPAILPGLFEGRTSRPGGAGIGLRHAREVVRRLGGDLVHVPGGPGEGATFVVRLLAWDSSARVKRSDRPGSSSISQEMRAAVQGARVLVLEDDHSVCALLETGLVARGMEVVVLHEANDLEARLAQIGDIDVILIDLSPIAHDVDGALAAVRRSLPRAGMVFISGSVVSLDRELMAAPRTRWVRKPFELGEITLAIAEILPPR